ncbi:MAG: hypothetical protein JWO11_2838 [Nocardioides sp.]|nr:hypothetical protein [Nocardioides sp.]
MDALDFGPATRTVAELVAAVRDDQLRGHTPCPAYVTADLLDHLGGLCLAFTAAARKTALPGAGADPSGDGSRLEDGWRDRLGTALGGLADAWDDPAAYDGFTQAGPVQLPAEVAALVALNEVVVHGWDLARATGQDYDPDAAAIVACTGFAANFEPPADADATGLFGPPVPVPDDAPALHRLLGLTGRDPAWTGSTA